MGRESFSQAMDKWTHKKLLSDFFSKFHIQLFMSDSKLKKIITHRVFKKFMNG